MEWDGTQAWEGEITSLWKENDSTANNFFKDEVTVTQYVPSFELFKTFSVMSACNIVCSCEMPQCVLQRCCGSRYKAQANRIAVQKLSCHVSQTQILQIRCSLLTITCKSSMSHTDQMHCT